ncbi:MAG: PH domain-containing protein [Promethearchaeota archaeon]
MPIYPNEVCPICGENPNLTYICEDCHEIFCEDCVDIHEEENLGCVQCGSTDIHYDKHGHPFCRDCGGNNLRTIKKLIPSCRICESENVISIVDKQKNLIEEFKTIIKDTRAFLRPFEELVERLNRYRHNLYQLRKEYPPCYHYPTLESDALILFKLFDKAKNTLYEHVNRFFQEIQHNINYIAEIHVTHPSNLTYIGEILKHFERERKKITNLSINNAENIDERLASVEEQIEFMESMQSLFTTFVGKLQLEPDEKIVYGLKCKLSTGTTKNKDFSNKNGTILITSKRLYFYHEQGVFQKRTVQLFSVKLSDLQQAGVKGKLKKKVSLEFLNSMYKFSITKDSRDKLIQWIENARKFDKNNIIDENDIKKLAKYKINTKLFREDLENTIYELIGFHGSFTNSQSLNQSNQTIHSSMYRRKGLQNPSSSSNQDMRFKPLNFPKNPQQPSIRENQGVFRTFSQNYEKSTKPLMTPAGHYGYPHDHSSSFNYPNFGKKEPNPVNYFNSSQSTEFCSPNPNSGLNIGNQSNFGHFSMEHSQNIKNYQNSPYSQNMNSFTSHYNEEMNLRKQVEQMRQEDFALNQTISMLEQRYDNGLINNVEFIKSYKEMQRQKYVIQSKINQIEKYLSEKTFNN